MSGKSKQYLFYGVIIIAAVLIYFKNQNSSDLDLSALRVYQNDVLKNVELPTDRLSIVHFYASWCGPCMQELPEINKSMSWLESNNISFIALTDDNQELINRLQESMQLQFPVYQLEHDMPHYGIRSIPTSYFVNSTGEVVHQVTGKLEWDEAKLIQLVKKHL